MAKRFTDTEKWNREWIRELPVQLKLAWIYLCDRCDHAGIWEIDIGLMNFQLGTKLNIEDLTEKLRVEVRGTSLFIEEFVEFQYGELNTANKVHRSVLTRLNKLAPSKPLASSYLGAKDKDKDKDKDKEKSTERANFDFEEVYKNYPRKEGKKKGILACKRLIRSQEDFDFLSKAVFRYSDHCRREKTETKFIMHFSTFMGIWEDWAHPQATMLPLTSSADALVEQINREAEALLRLQGNAS